MAIADGLKSIKEHLDAGRVKEAEALLADLTDAGARSDILWEAEVAIDMYQCGLHDTARRDIANLARSCGRPQLYVACPVLPGLARPILPHVG